MGLGAPDTECLVALGFLLELPQDHESRPVCHAALIGRCRFHNPGIGPGGHAEPDQTLEFLVWVGTFRHEESVALDNAKASR